MTISGLKSACSGLVAACLLTAFTGKAALGEGGNAAELAAPQANGLEEFLDEFFTRFADLSKNRRAGSTNDRAMIPLLRLTKSKYERSPAARRGPRSLEPSIGMIAKLWLHGPKSWTVTEMEILGDSAFAKVFFNSVMAGRPDPIPFGFKFQKAGKNWKISGFVDLRSVNDASGNWHDLVVSSSNVTPEKAFTAYMDEIERYYAPRNAKNSMQIAPQVQENLSPMWMPTEDAGKSLSRSMMTFSQIQPRNWQFVSSDIVGEDAELVIKASSGNPVMRRNLGMAAMMGSGLMFRLERVDDAWLLKDYGRSSSKNN